MDLASLSIYTFAVTGFCLLAIVLLSAVIVCLLLRLNRLEKMTTPQKHSFFNEAIQPDEELSRRGFTMYRGSSYKGSDSMKTNDTSLTSSRTLRNPHADWRNAVL